MMKMRTWLTIGLLITLLTCAGCLRRADEGQGLEAAQSRPLPSPTVEETPTLEPSLTEEPTEEIVFAEETATETPEIPTETPTPGDTPTPTETPTPEPSISPTANLLDFSTETPTPNLLDLSTETPTEDPVSAALTQVAMVSTEAPIEVAQEAPPDDDQLTATAIIAAATQFYIDQTLTAEAELQITLATETPLPDFGMTETPTPFTQPTSPGGFGECVHIVRAGDNLFRISLTYGTLIDDIAARNGIANPQLIIVGQELVIPNCQGGGAPVPGTGGTTNPNCATTGGRYQHVVKQGETLYQISLLYDNVTYQQIADANCITNINFIRYSDVLVIP